MASAPCAFLLPRLLASASHFTSAFGICSARTRVTAHTLYYLMHQICAPSDAKNFLWKTYNSHVCAFLVINFCFHVFVITLILSQLNCPSPRVTHLVQARGCSLYPPTRPSNSSL